MNYDLYWIWMSCGLGAGARCLDLISYYEWNPYEIYASSFNEIFSLDMLTKRQVEKLKSFPLEKAQKIYDTVKENGWEIVTPVSKYYPQALLNLQDLPLVLYVDGDETILSEELTISIVGSRSASGYSRAVARALASTMAEIGFTVVSGGALGVDSYSHLGALDGKGKTICVLGCGLGTKYLMENQPLRDKVAKNGAVITEYPPFTPAGRDTFPLRNRIISGLSLGTVVVEAGLRSGSLITARYALEQGRDVFAVPGDLISSSFLGTNQLIQSGATAVFSPNDILETYYARYYDRLGNVKSYKNDEIMLRTQKYLKQIEREEKESGIITPSHEVKEKKSVSHSVKKENMEAKADRTATAKKEAPSYLTEAAKKIYDFLNDEPKHIDEIINCCGFTTEKTLSSVTELEIYGLVEQLSGRRYKAK